MTDFTEMEALRNTLRVGGAFADGVRISKETSRGLAHCVEYVLLDMQEKEIQAARKWLRQDTMSMAYNCGLMLVRLWFVATLVSWLAA